MVERAAVNRRVVGSSPTRGALNSSNQPVLHFNQTGFDTKTLDKT